MTSKVSHRIAGVLAVVAGLWSISGCQFASVHANEQEMQAQTASASQENELVIKTDSDLPDTYPRGNYLVHLVAIGGLTPLHWSLERGSLPPGIRLEDHGVLQGAAERGGEFQFTLSVRDSGHPPALVRKQFMIHVRTALSLNWKSIAHVNGDRIEGSVEVSNATLDNMDLTFIVLAVASSGRATAIGYQHFPLLKGTIAKELPFGDTMPRGEYVVHVDTIGEVAPKNVIYRQRMQTPKPLQVTVGP
jgi:hypothetical protein